MIVTIVCFSSFSGCILNELFGTSFSLTSWNVCDDDGFPGLSLVFSSSGTVTVKLFGPDDSVLDSDLFFYGDHDAVLHLASYRKTVTSGQYRLKVYDKNVNVIFARTFSFDGAELSISSYDQKWWKQETGKDSYSLVGLTLSVHNDGDIPLYPYTAEVVVDSETISSFVLPAVVLPNESKLVDCFVYNEDTPEDSIFIVSLKDSLGDTLGTGSFSAVMEYNVIPKEFKWIYTGSIRRLRIPYPEFLFDYYSDIDRSLNEDYGIYVFDLYDDAYIDLLVERLISLKSCDSDVDKINFAASFVQKLDYKKDSPTDDSFEYPRYPIETLDGGGDCEDKAILMASILSGMGYEVALFRLPNHMAVGVHLDITLNDYEYYTDDYYFLETTAVKPLGFTPDNHKSPSELTVYPISSRPLLLHNWKNGNLTIFTNTELGDLVKVTLIVENLGSDTAEDILVKGGFYTQYGLELNNETEVISSLEPGMKNEVTIMVDIPKSITTWFKTGVYLDNEVVDEQESASSFP